MVPDDAAGEDQEDCDLTEGGRERERERTTGGVRAFGGRQGRLRNERLRVCARRGPLTSLRGTHFGNFRLGRPDLSGHMWTANIREIRKYRAAGTAYDDKWRAHIVRTMQPIRVWGARNRIGSDCVFLHD